ncbi:hypothetical protein [Methylocystis echinoides]|uniref:hypothetical protein n=1 Tax=Methylocystis echinoides TaxID=29468 RepID=UPI00343EBED6
MSDATITETHAPKSFAELRQITLRIAQQLPENPDDANAVAGLLCDLVEWLHPRDFSADKRSMERRGND